MQDVQRTIISQYANSPIITALIGQLNTNIDPTANIDAFFTLMWDVLSAVGYGLDVWGIIVGIGRVIPVDQATFIGFEQGGWETFGNGIWFSGTPTLAGVSLSDDAYRLLILAKAAANISNGSCQSINSILLALFPGRGDCYSTDGLNETMTYTFAAGFTPPLTPVELGILTNTDVMPRPSGVAASVVQL